MEKDKLNQASVDYSRSLYTCGMYDKETPATPEDITFAFIAGSNYVMGQPLSERISEEEREKIKAIYAETQEWLAKNTNDYNYYLKFVAVVLQYKLESIFGKEMFE